ncbi:MULTISPECIES: rhamnogalacturonan lyase [unclassified Streptomyces]|uniref:rhamnogalacturonan lyase n=1 Tax=unclassified Streptomyces TaxID=2593676 RepID=UPI000DAC2AD6|nr:MULTISPECIES: rhamnogalacturonan lyase [unclassified Streptomyces]PZT73531.1 rhamnogalacturonan lyase [Streptomyces sp. AC1-42T]PZT83476.1 rhamnogalacturonan lyase [Streptomyces sp. AC1-42W]
MVLGHPRTTGRPRTTRTRTLLGAVTAGLLATTALVVTGQTSHAATARQVEALDRGVVSVHTGSGNLVSRRWLATDPDTVAFNVYRAGTKVNSSPVTGSTNYFHAGAPSYADYTVRAVVNGVEQGDSAHAIQFRAGYKDVPISPPPGGTTPDGVPYTYEANDVSAGDLDGDGALDFVLKWQPTNAKDNSRSGYTGNTVVDGVRLDGTRLWRVDLGRNIRSGAHYTQFQVYDYDGDGRAEVAMKTADGTVDGRGTVLGSASADHRNSAGYVLSGPEYLTMFNGLTGAAMGTVDYVPARGSVSSWGDGYGNRVDRFLAGTAYLDGGRPSLIMARGYYTRTVIAAWDWRGGAFTRRWTFDTNSSTNTGRGYDGQGNHQLSVADVDGDGRDEIVYGAMAVDDDGRSLWTTRNGHGDAMHVGDLDPARPGLEEFKVDEDGSKPSSWMADARTGQIIWSTPAGGDNGRGVSGDIWAGSAGAESWSSAASGIRDPHGTVVASRKPSSTNFLAWWDGDTTRELLDGTHIDKYGTSGDTRLLTAASVHSDNGTKATPALSGDRREEVVWPTVNNTALRIYSTPYETGTRITTLLHDTTYRTAPAWQNTAYNQPPHPGFFIGSGMPPAPRPTVRTP